ncbi:MAG: hypothetical protein IIT61_00630, partial [Bacteroidales bacterium]|nr:hypothetical protein [Bacteroidales bacterium]
MQNKREILLYFGSFNPIHIGHLAIANYLAEYTDVNELWFVVTPHNPLKKSSTLIDDRVRQHLVQLAIGNYPKFRVSDVEFYLPKPNYTINTLTYLSEKYPDPPRRSRSRRADRRPYHRSARGTRGASPPRQLCRSGTGRPPSPRQPAFRSFSQ